MAVIRQQADLDFGGVSRIIRAVLNPVTTDPAEPVNGEIWYNSTEGVLKARQGGVTEPLGGSAVDLDAHINNATNAHAASAISATDSLYGIDGTTVQSQLGQLSAAVDTVDIKANAAGSAIQLHVFDTSDAHDASAVSFDPSSTDLSATDVQAAIAELDTNVATTQATAEAALPGVVSESEPGAPAIGSVWVKPGMAHTAVVAALDLPRLLVYDTFDRPDGDLGAADSGQAWVPSGTGWGIEDGMAFKADEQAQSYAVLDAGATDLDIEASLIGSNNSGIVFRHDGNPSASQATYLMARISAPDSFALLSRTAGTPKSHVEEAVAVPAGSWYRMRVIVRGDLVRVFLDGIEVITHTLVGGDESTFVGSFVGFRSSNDTNTRFDNLTARAA